MANKAFWRGVRRSYFFYLWIGAIAFFFWFISHPVSIGFILLGLLIALLSGLISLGDYQIMHRTKTTSGAVILTFFWTLLALSPIGYLLWIIYDIVFLKDEVLLSLLKEMIR